MKELHKSDYPLIVNDECALLEVRLTYGQDGVHVYLLDPDESLDIEKHLQSALDQIFDGYEVENVALQRAMGGPNYCSIRTLDHFDGERIHSFQHLNRWLEECCVVWTSGDFYFDLRD